MVVFTLTMPNVGSWNNKWSQADKVFARSFPERVVPKILWDNNFYYRWDDGWTACVSVEQMPAREANKIMRKSSGFCGYDWMIKSILENGEIRCESEDE